MKYHYQKPEQLEKLDIIIAKISGVKLDGLYSRRRDALHANARAVIWYIAHEHMGFPYLQLGKFYDRDHTTVMSGIAKIRKRKDIDHLVIDKLKKKHPEIFQVTNPKEPGSPENWKF